MSEDGETTFAISARGECFADMSIANKLSM